MPIENAPWPLMSVAMYGYLALFLVLFLEELGVPLPLPGDLALLFTGFLVGRGVLRFEVAVLTVVLAGFGGASALYLLSRRYGRTAVERYGRYLHLDPARLAWLEARFRRFGPLAVLVARVTPGLRIYTSILAGLGRVPYSRFALALGPAALLWAVAFIWLGGLVGERWDVLGALLEHHAIRVAAAVGLFALLGVAGWRWARRFRRPGQTAGTLNEGRARPMTRFRPGPATARRRALIASGVALIYATCFVAIKAGLAYAPPLLFGGLRALIAGLILLAAVIALRRPFLPAARAWPRVGALALLATLLTFGAMFLSPGRTGAGIASVLGNVQPLLAVALAAAFLGERLTRGKAVALGLGLVGVALISSTAPRGSGSDDLAGPILAVLMSVASAAGSVIVKRMGPQPSLLAVTGWQLVLGSLPLLAISAFVERGAAVVWSPEFVGLLLFLALVGTALTFAVWYWLIQHDEVGRLTMFLFLVPIFGLALAALVFSERVGALEGVGVAFTIAGIGAVAWESRRGTPR